ncbi:MAG: Tol-Pal system protein TolB [Pelagibacterales bacterium]|nr:Tol-Pal system protein TolB [Pelagibacterales bacterium]
MRLLKIFPILTIIFLSLNNAQASVAFSIDNKEIPKTKVLFLGFDSSDRQLKSDTFEVFERIRKNLKTTDLFEIIFQAGPQEVGAFGVSSPSLDSVINAVASINPIEVMPDFDKYNKIGVGAIVIGSFSYDANGNLETKIRMWDVLDQRQLFGKFYSTSRGNYKKIANLISDEVFKAISGEKLGHFNTQILYVSESGSVNNLIKRINIIDFDGENRRFLTNGENLVLTPAFSKKVNEIFYLSYSQGRPQIFSLDVKSFKTKKVGNFNGTTFSPASHPKDQNLLLMSATIDGNTDIYEMNVLTNSAKRLTKSPAIDTTPSYSPDGKLIAFASDRDSSQQLYIMDLRGDSVRRISSEGGSYSKPIWSPDGNLIAFTKIKSNRFYVGVMSPNNKGEKILTSAYLVEGARWSPNGRYLIYSKKTSQYGRGSIPRLFICDIVTGFEFEVPTPSGEGATDPDWA